MEQVEVKNYTMWSGGVKFKSLSTCLESWLTFLVYLCTFSCINNICTRRFVKCILPRFSHWNTAGLLANQRWCFVHLQVFSVFYLFFHLLPSSAHRLLGEESVSASQEHGDHSADAQQRNRRRQVTARAHSWEKRENINYRGLSVAPVLEMCWPRWKYRCEGRKPHTRRHDAN